MKMPLYNKHHPSSNQRFLPLLDSYFILNCCRSNLHDDVWCLSKYHHSLLWKYLFTRSRFMFLTRFFFKKNKFSSLEISYMCIIHSVCLLSPYPSLSFFTFPSTSLPSVHVHFLDSWVFFAWSIYRLSWVICMTTGLRLLIGAWWGE